jgi:hypothetical protein
MVDLLEEEKAYQEVLKRTVVQVQPSFVSAEVVVEHCC